MSSIMKGLVQELNLFNRWQDFGKYYGSQFAYQTTKVPDTQKLYITQVKHVKSGVVVCKAYGMSDESSKENAVKLLNGAGVESVRNAITTKQPIVQQYPSKVAQVKKDIEQRMELEKQQQMARDIKWWDGARHRDRAQKKIVGEKKLIKKKGK